jgi:formate dehydrogenase major subunit
MGYCRRTQRSGGPQVGLKDTFLGWPVLRQITGDDPLGRGSAAQSKKTAALRPRTATADRVVQSVCPYCAVGCGQKVYVKDEKVVQIEGDPDSPVSRGGCARRGRRASSSSTAPSASRRCGTGAPAAPSGRTSTSTRRWR